MRYLALLLVTAQLSCQGTSTAPEAGLNSKKSLQAGSPEAYAATITQEELKERLYTYASDEFEGRETGTRGEEKAVEYLVDHYKALGIPGALPGNSYRQAVPLAFSQPPTGTLSFNGTTFSNGEGFVCFTGADLKDVEIVYAGYGIDSPEYSDFSGLDVSGKLILARHGEPKNPDGTYRISGTTNPSAWGNSRNALGKRLEAAKAKGALGVLFYDPDNYNRYNSSLRRMKRSGNGRLNLMPKEGSPLYLILDSGTALAIHPQIEQELSPGPIKKSVSVLLQSEIRPVNAYNVIGFIQGKSKPEEYIVVSAHLDHIGMNGDVVNNGADDDGSGTVAVMEIAEAFRKAQLDGNGPERSIVFLHVTGEEKGLFGSKYYTDYSPVFPLEDTKADLNIDMIGRIDPKRKGDRNYVYLIGSDKLSTELHRISEEVNARYCNITLDYTYNRKDDPNRFYYRSDHYNFAKNNIPVIFYFNGTHADYHRPSDTPDKINYDLLENRARLVFHTAWELANREKTVEVDADKKASTP